MDGKSTLNVIKRLPTMHNYHIWFKDVPYSFCFLKVTKQTSEQKTLDSLLMRKITFVNDSGLGEDKLWPHCRITSSKVNLMGNRCVMDLGWFQMTNLGVVYNFECFKLNLCKITVILHGFTAMFPLLGWPKDRVKTYFYFYFFHIMSVVKVF